MRSFSTELSVSCSLSFAPCAPKRHLIMKRYRLLRIFSLPLPNRLLNQLKSNINWLFISHHCYYLPQPCNQIFKGSQAASVIAFYEIEKLTPGCHHLHEGQSVQLLISALLQADEVGRAVQPTKMKSISSCHSHEMKYSAPLSTEQHKFRLKSKQSLCLTYISAK